MSGTDTLVVVVDDERTHRGADVHLRSSADALEWLAGHDGCSELWLDHDLGGDDTTRPVVMWLVEQAVTAEAFPIGTVVVHSMNPPGAEWVAGSLERFYRVRRGRIA